MIRFSIVMIALIVLLITGCAGFQTDIRTFDELPDNAHRGYVEFYSDESKDAIELYKNIGGTWTVFQYDEDGIGTEIEGMVWDWRTRRRIAVLPGQHTFAVKFGTGPAPQVTVEVDEGMIIPVRVIIASYAYKERAYHFKMSLSIEDAIPFVSSEK